MSNINEQPDYATKVKTLNGEKTGWDYRTSVPGAPTVFWTNDDWIRFIGDNWFKKPEGQVLS